ncbi:MAG: acyl-CoA dehydrogenase family protein [Bacilli bacterium]|jgi:alkylation response protein AidB-like acyl-CoA dehydrogenase|nr:acyl-CoA dehydrogenase family protein [Bacilli bacterium]
MHKEKLIEEVKEFCEKEIKPFAYEWDMKNIYPEDVVKKIAAKGWLGIPFAKEYGGMGLDTLTFTKVVETIASYDASCGAIVSTHTALATWPIYQFGNDFQKKKYLIDLCNGNKLGAFGLTEEKAGSDAAYMQTTAIEQDDCYLLNGKKIFITNSKAADTYVVFALTQQELKTKGISAFIIEKGMPGFSFSEPYDKMGIRASITCELHFDNVKVPKENLLGEKNKGFKIAMSALNGGRIGIASQATGIALGAYQEALAYSKERIQFNKPIFEQEVISFKLADMFTKITASRLLVADAANKKDNNEDYIVAAACAKSFASDNAVAVCDEALQIFGGSGYMKGKFVEKMYRDARITKIYEGTNEIQRVIIANYLAKQ